MNDGQFAPCAAFNEPPGFMVNPVQTCLREIKSVGVCFEVTFPCFRRKLLVELTEMRLVFMPCLCTTINCILSKGSSLGKERETSCPSTFTG